MILLFLSVIICGFFRNVQSCIYLVIMRKLLLINHWLTILYLQEAEQRRDDDLLQFDQARSLIQAKLEGALAERDILQAKVTHLQSQQTDIAPKPGKVCLVDIVSIIRYRYTLYVCTWIIHLSGQLGTGSLELWISS